MKLPVSLIIDDAAPRVSVFYEHAARRTTDDGRPILREFPNRFLFDFCDVTERYGIRGKFSVVPMPGGKGDIVNGIAGYSDGEIREWLDTVRGRVTKYFSLCPEMLTHAKAVDLCGGGLLDCNEDVWASTRDAEELTPYIAKALSLLKEADLCPTGVTSPWYFGSEVEEEYVKAIAAAFDGVCGRKDSWYFLHTLDHVKNAKPWLALNENGRRVVSVPSTMDDLFWQTIHVPQASPAYISRIADCFLTEDGSDGEIIRVMEDGGWPILLSHWQSLYSNGTAAGLQVLAEVARRIEVRLSDRLEWKSAAEMMELVLADPGQYPKPEF